MTKKGWIILASVLVVGAGVGTYLVIKNKNKNDDKDEDKSNARGRAGSDIGDKYCCCKEGGGIIGADESCADVTSMTGCRECQSLRQR